MWVLSQPQKIIRELRPSPNKSGFYFLPPCIQFNVRNCASVFCRWLSYEHKMHAHFNALLFRYNMCARMPRRVIDRMFFYALFSNFRRKCIETIFFTIWYTVKSTTLAYFLQCVAFYSIFVRIYMCEINWEVKESSNVIRKASVKKRKFIPLIHKFSAKIAQNEWWKVTILSCILLVVQCFHWKSM